MSFRFSRRTVLYRSSYLYSIGARCFLVVAARADSSQVTYPEGTGCCKWEPALSG
jgi:hypothetical protein